MKAKLSLLAALALAASPALAVDTYNVDKVHSNAQFTIRHLMSKVTGKFTDIDGIVQIDRAKPEASSVDFTIKTASISTGASNMTGPTMRKTRLPAISRRATRSCATWMTCVGVCIMKTRYCVPCAVTLAKPGVPCRSSSARVEENAGADDLVLTSDQLSRLSAIRPPVGDRYADMAPVNR